MIPCSFGEVIDKITILEIKSMKSSNKEQDIHIKYELDQLKIFRKINDSNYYKFHQELFNINWTLWNLEDKIRYKSKRHEFDQDYIDCAELIHKTNDQRYQIKKKINQHYQSDIQEEKIYQLL